MMHSFIQRATPGPSPSRRVRALALSGVCLGVAALVLSLSAGNEAFSETLSAWAGPLYGRLLLLHAAVVGALMFAGVAVAGLLVEALISFELAHKAVLATIVAAPLAFAQQAGTSSGRPEAGPGTQAEAARREIQLGLYGGGNGVFNGDIFLKQPNGTDMTLKNVRWSGEPFDDPPYYGVRATYWPARSPSLGVMIDYTHGKAISRRHEEVEQTGMRDGKPVPAREPVSATFTKIEYSHGLNFLTLNAVYRFRGLHRRIVPYFGLGMGIMTPHSEAARRGVARQDWTYRYEVSGPGFQGLAGIEWRVKPQSRFQPFTEVKLGYGRNHTELREGGWVETNLFAYQFALGLNAYTRPPLPAGPAR
jgi:lipid A oxidase